MLAPFIFQAEELLDLCLNSQRDDTIQAEWVDIP